MRQDQYISRATIYWVLTMYLTLISTLPAVFLLIFTKILRQVLLVPTFYRQVSSSRSGNLSEVTHLIAKPGAWTHTCVIGEGWVRTWVLCSVTAEGFDGPRPPLPFHLILALGNSDFVLFSFPVIDTLFGISFVLINVCWMNECTGQDAPLQGFCTDLGWLLISFVKTQVIMQRQ